VDGRADIYALGAMMYAMIEGRPPFVRATDLATMMAQVSDPPPPMESGTGSALDTIVRTCLAKRPDDRYASVGELAAALGRLGSVSTTEGTPPRRSATVVRRSPKKSAFAIDPIVYVTLVIALGVLNGALLAKRLVGPIHPVGSPVVHHAESAPRSSR